MGQKDYQLDKQKLCFSPPVCDVFFTSCSESFLYFPPSNAKYLALTMRIVGIDS